MDAEVFGFESFMNLFWWNFKKYFTTRFGGIFSLILFSYIDLVVTLE